MAKRYRIGALAAAELSFKCEAMLDCPAFLRERGLSAEDVRAIMQSADQMGARPRGGSFEVTPSQADFIAEELWNAAEIAADNGDRAASARYEKASSRARSLFA